MTPDTSDSIAPRRPADDSSLDANVGAAGAGRSTPPEEARVLACAPLYRSLGRVGSHHLVFRLGGALMTKLRIGKPVVRETGVAEEAEPIVVELHPKHLVLRLKD